MPFALTFLGLMLIITGFQDTYKQAGSLVRSDFSGPNNFLFWLVAILIVGSLGYIKGLETFSKTFMALLLIGIVVTQYKNNNNIFNVVANLLSGSTGAVDAIGTPLQGGGSSSYSTSSSSSGNIQQYAQYAGYAETAAQLFA